MQIKTNQFPINREIVAQQYRHTFAGITPTDQLAEHFNIRITDMHSPRRSRSVARPRQIAMYLAKSITSRSLPEIGRKFGGRDHTTVMHAVKKIEELKLQDVNFNEDIELLKRLIDS